MGILWEAYHKGVPLLGVPENPIDLYKVEYEINSCLKFPYEINYIPYRYPNT